MSYGKKDEDSEGSVLKVDRVAVFQEGKALLDQLLLTLLTRLFSSIVQLLPNITTEMSRPSYQNCFASIHRRCFPSQRSDRPFLRNFQALPEQGPLSPADDVPSLQGACELCIGCDNDDSEYN